MSLFNPYNLVAIGDPVFEAVTVQEIKDQARIYQSVDDAYIGLLLVAAREQVETDLNVAIVQQNYQWILPHGFFTEALFPPFGASGNYGGYGYNSYYYQVGWYSLNWYPRLRMPIQPVQSVASITYTDINNAPQTLDPSNYTAKLYADPPEIWWVSQIPGIAPASDVIITFTAGWPSPGDVIDIESLQIVSGGTGYTDGTYQVAVTGNPGTGQVTLTVLGGVITEAVVANRGTGFTSLSNYTTSAFNLSGLGGGSAANLSYNKAPNAIPQLIKMAIKLLCCSWYEQRTPVSEALVRPVPLSYERIINILQVKRFK